MNDNNSLEHTRWNCKYHVVFAPKYRRQVFYKEKKQVVGEILRQLCVRKSVNIVEASEDECIKLYGLSERQKQLDDIRKIWGYEIQVQKQTVLVPGILRGYGRKKREEDSRIHQRAIG